MVSRAALFVSLACSTAVFAAEPPLVTPHQLPEWFPVQGLFKPDWVHAENYCEQKFSVGDPARKVETVTVRGRCWRANLDTLTKDRKEWEKTAFARWKEREPQLAAAGFQKVYFKQDWDNIKTTYRRGEGERATYLRVTINIDPRGSQMAAAQGASNPLSIVLAPPAAKPETFGDRDDFPYLTPPPGSKLTNTGHNQGPMHFPPASGQPTPVGSGTIDKYYAPDPTLSPLAFHDAYTAALKQAGWMVTHDDPVQGFAWAHYDKNGRDLYAYAVLRDEGIHFSVADVGSGLRAALAKGCKAALWGVNFDFDKATLRPDANAALGQVLRLLNDEPALAVEIGGHTDDVGKPDYNLALSDRRAAAVKQWLVAHGVAAARLSSHGYGDTQPLVPNSSDENRARNRRVELKKPSCH
jgi:OOP family OmpA-OmpF porin